MNYFLAFLLTLILVLVLKEKRKIDSVHALLQEFHNERLMKKREAELESLLKQFAIRN